MVVILWCSLSSFLGMFQCPWIMAEECSDIFLVCYKYGNLHTVSSALFGNIIIFGCTVDNDVEALVHSFLSLQVMCYSSCVSM